MKNRGVFTLLAVLGVLCLFIVFTGCNNSNTPSSDPPPGNVPPPMDRFPQLRVVNEHQGGRVITRVGLVGYDFSDLQITMGNSQTFNLMNGMPAGHSNINIAVTFNNAWGGGLRFLSRSVNFVDGETTTIILRSDALLE